MRSETVPIDSLSFDPANVRKHGERNLATIKASLLRFGQQKPIVVDANGVVRAGNGTLAAAKALGWKEIAVVRSTLAGSGTTVIACERTGRTCMAMELEPAYCDVIVKRWETLTGRKAELAKGQD